MTFGSYSKADFAHVGTMEENFLHNRNSAAYREALSVRKQHKTCFLLRNKTVYMLASFRLVFQHQLLSLSSSFCFVSWRCSIVSILYKSFLRIWSQLLHLADQDTNYMMSSQTLIYMHHIVCRLSGHKPVEYVQQRSS